MGLIVECRGEEVWAPSVRAGYLFVEQMRTLERLIDQDSGVSAVVADTVEIDAAVLNAFIEAMLSWLSTTNHGPIHAMVEGCLAVAIALNVRISGTWPVTSEYLRPLIEKARTVMAPRAVPLSERAGAHDWQVQR